ncbi:MAG: hypothetical protein RLZZ127_609, partial [Planctomycetota bacterium]
MAPRSFLGVGSPAATLIPHLALSAVLVAGAVIALRLPTSPVRPSVPPADPVPALTAAGADDSVARVLDTAIPRGEREAVIDDLALSSGPGSARDLMAIGDAGSDLGPRAIRRLGLRPRPEVRAYLERRVRDHGAPRAAELAAAAESLAEVAGPAAVPALADLLRAARRRT